MEIAGIKPSRFKAGNGRSKRASSGRVRGVRSGSNFRRSIAKSPFPKGITVKELAEKLGVKANMVIKKPGGQEDLRDHQPGARCQAGRAGGARVRRVHQQGQLRRRIDARTSSRPRSRRIASSGRPWSRSWATSITVKPACWTPSGSPTWPRGEAGGITQHIGAYQIEKNGRKIVFIDTPGHEAFTRMRARGAKVTDMVVLVVAADDGVMPQTLEAIDHAKAAKVPIIVAINKIDKSGCPAGADQAAALRSRAAGRRLGRRHRHGARFREDEDQSRPAARNDPAGCGPADLKANPERPAVGNVLEAQLDRGRGPVATVLVRNGTLRNGDFFICGAVFGKVRAMFNDRGELIKEAEPSMPVEVLGLDSLPEVGDTFQVVTDTQKAKQIVIYREPKERDARWRRAPRDSRQAAPAVARGRGQRAQHHHQGRRRRQRRGHRRYAAEAVEREGPDTRAPRRRGRHQRRRRAAGLDLGRIVIGFNVRPERNAQSLAEQEKVDIRLHTIIYDLVDEIRRAMTGMLEPIFKEVFRGRAEVRETFRITKVGTVAGCMVQEGTITRDSQVRLLRDNIVIHTGKIDALKRFKNDASEVKSGFECGISLVGYNDIKVGDIIEAFVTERIAAELSV